MWCLQSVWFVQIFVCEIRNGRQTEGMMSFAQFLVSHACHNFEYFLNSCNLRKVNYVHKNYNTYKIILHCSWWDESLVGWTNVCVAQRFSLSEVISALEFSYFRHFRHFPKNLYVKKSPLFDLPILNSESQR